MLAKSEYQLLHAVPGDLRSNAEQNEGDHAQNAVDGLAGNPGSEAGRVGIAEIDSDAVQDNGGNNPGVRQRSGEERLLGGVGAQRECDSECAWPGGDRKGEGIENFFVERTRIIVGGNHVFARLLTLFIEKFPANRHYYQAARKLYHGKRDAEEGQYCGAQHVHNKKKDDSGESDLARQPMIDLRRRRPNDAKENQCGANRVDEGQKSAESKRKKFGHKQHARPIVSRVAAARGGAENPVALILDCIHTRVYRLQYFKYSPLFRIFGVIVLLCGLTANALAADLKEKTATAFDRYVSATEARFNNELKPGGAFLYVDALPQEEMKNSYDRLKQGEILVERLKTQAPGLDGDVPGGMLHHWVGLVFVPGVTLQQTLPVVQDYDHRSDLYRPEVIASKLVSRQGDDFKIFLRLYEKKFTTVVFNTNYDVRWGRVAPNEMFSNSISTRITEVKDASHPDGPEYPPGQGSGYLWRLNTYWRFEEKDGGVYIQCEALSLTRDIPSGLGWLLRPLVTAVPKHSLNAALGRTREVVKEQVAVQNHRAASK
jgi:hypothetical protein